MKTLKQNMNQTRISTDDNSATIYQTRYKNMF